MKRFLFLFLFFCIQSLLYAESIEQQYPVVKTFFPQATHFSEAEGKPPAISVYKDKTLLGYIFETVQVAPIPAYSGKPINILMGMDITGKIRGSKILEHHEPILLVGIPESKLQDFSNQYTDKQVTDRVKVGSGSQPDHIYVDAITGATVTVLVVNETMMRAARKIAISRKIMEAKNQQNAATVRMDHDKPASWQDLTGNGAIRRLHLNRGDVDKAFAGKETEETNAETDEERAEEFIDLYYAYLDVPTIGRNLLGDDQYKWLKTELKEGDHAIAVLANGTYSFKGNGFVRGGIFDRVQLEQDQTITFHDLDYFRLSDVYAEGMPDFKEMAIFIIRAANEFNPAEPWNFELLVRRQTGPLSSIFSNFSSEYQLPEDYLKLPPPPVKLLEETEPMPIWLTVWHEKTFEIIVLVMGLVVLSLILILQDWLVRYPKILKRIRIGFLLYTLIFIGWYALAQLSVVNVLTFVNAVMNDFRWDTFLIDPLMFILWGFVAVTLLIVGRGVYCGWLCPFGALQDLINQVARYFKVKQWEFPDLIHERLWAIKYIILLGLFAISLQSLGEAERFAEVEPFKTVIILHFQRQWGFLFYGILLLILTIFNHKFYCKYLCPLGAALAIAAKMRLFDWLRRRNECGSPCQLCAVRCEVRAIDKTGHINPNECHYCLDCQVTYWDNHDCPPLIAKRKRKEKSHRAKQSVKQMEQAMGTKSGLDDISPKK